MSTPEAVQWLRAQVETRLARARALLCEEWAGNPWDVTECANEASGDCPCIVYQGEYTPGAEAQVPPIRYIADAETPEIASFIAANDPQQVIADCEADLAILDEHRQQGVDNECARCSDWDEGEDGSLCAYPLPWPCATVRAVAGRFKHQPGYAAHWGESETMGT